ncbi:MAG: hypothetical protein JSR90_12135 [Proteobacteria bacterium]|nr:hypothetical protein [Pseudomonadota bacterium]
MRPRFIVVAALVALALAAIVRPDKGGKPADGTANVAVKRTVAAAVPTPPPKAAPAVPSIAISGRDRDAVYAYYGTKLTALTCPAGLVKKSGGCVPPEGGQGNWRVGERLPDDVIVYPLPAVLLGQVYPPNGYQYVRVGNDVLLLGIETRLVAGALADVEGG